MASFLCRQARATWSLHNSASAASQTATRRFLVHPKTPLRFKPGLRNLSSTPENKNEALNKFPTELHAKWSRASATSKRAAVGAIACAITAVAAAYVYSSASKQKQNKNADVETKDAETEESTPEDVAEDEKIRKSDFGYIVLGGGTAAYNAVKGIQEVDKNAEILLISDEAHPPYRRPFLSKCGLFKLDYDTSLESATEEDIDAEPLFYRTIKEWGDQVIQLKQDPDNLDSLLSAQGSPGVRVLLNAKVTGIGLKEQTVKFNTQEHVGFAGYRKLIIATGSQPTQTKDVDFQGAKVKDENNVIYYYNLEHQKKLAECLNPNALDQTGKRNVAVYGNGLLAVELAGAFSEVSNVSLLMPGTRLLEDMLPPSASAHVEQWLTEAGVRVVSKKKKEAGLPEFDAIVVADEVNPDGALFKTAGLETDESGGVVVNPELQARQNVYAAGSVASYYDVASGCRRRLLQYEVAAMQGRTAGHNAASESAAVTARAEEAGRVIVQKARSFTYEPTISAQFGGCSTYLRNFYAAGNTSGTAKTVTVCNGLPATSQDFRSVIFFLEKDSKDTEESKITGVAALNMPDTASLKGYYQPLAVAKRIAKGNFVKADATELAKYFPLYGPIKEAPEKEEQQANNLEKESTTA